MRWWGLYLFCLCAKHSRATMTPLWFCIICQGCEETESSPNHNNKLSSSVEARPECPTGGAAYCEKLMRTTHERFKSKHWETQNKELSFRSFWKLQEITYLFFSFLWKYPVKIQPRKYKRCYATFKTIKNTHRSGFSNSPSVLFIHSLGTECLTVFFHSCVWAFGNR